MTVVGDVDPVSLTRKIRKTGKVVDIISVGPPKPPEPPEPAPDPDTSYITLPNSCNDCQFVAVSYAP